MTAAKSAKRRTSFVSARTTFFSSRLQAFGSLTVVQPPLPSCPDGAPLGCDEKMLEGDVHEREPGLGHELSRVPELAAHIDPPPLLSSTQARTESGWLIGTGRR